MFIESTNRLATVLATTAVVAMGAPAAAHADDNSDVGVGLAVGEPTGVSTQFDLDAARSAVNVAAGYDFQEHRHVNADYIVYPATVRLGRAATMPFYVGVGGFVKDHPADMGPHAGARMPLGLEIDFDAPVQVFGELTPSLTLVETDPELPHPMALAGTVGVRARL